MNSIFDYVGYIPTAVAAIAFLIFIIRFAVKNSKRRNSKIKNSEHK